MDYLTDYFTDADGTELGDHAMDAGPAWIPNFDVSIQIQSNRAVGSNSGGAYIADSGHADYVITCTVNVPSGSNGGIHFRTLTDFSYYAYVRFVQGTTNNVLVKVGETTVATGSAPVPADTDVGVTLTVVGATVAVKVGASTVVTYSSLANTAATYVGLNGNGRATFDDFVAGPALTNYSVTTSKGVFTLTGKSAGLKCGRKTAGAKGSFSFTGKAAGTTATRKVTGGKGSFSLTGQAAAVRASRRVSAAKRSFVLTGKSSTIKAVRTVPAGKGVFALTGKAAGLKWAHRAAEALGAFALTGKAAGTAYGHRSVGAKGVYTFTGRVAGLKAGRRFAGAKGSFPLTGRDAALTSSGAVVNPTVASVSPASVGQGTTAPLTITGTGFRSGAAVTFSGSGLSAGTAVVASPTQILVLATATLAATASARDVTVTNADTGSDTLASGVSVAAEYARDSFTDSNGTAIGSHTSEQGSVANAVGIFTIQSNRLKCTTPTDPATNYVTTTATGSGGVVGTSVTVRTPAVGKCIATLMFNVVDASNYWELAIQDFAFNVALNKVVAGSAVQAAAFTIPTTTTVNDADYTLAVYANGDRVLATVFFPDGSSHHFDYTTSGRAFKTSEVCGLKVYFDSGWGDADKGSAFDDYRVCAYDPLALVAADNTLAAHQPAGRYSAAGRDATAWDMPAFKTLQAALLGVSPGGTVRARDGTFAETAGGSWCYGGPDVAADVSLLYYPDETSTFTFDPGSPPMVDGSNRGQIFYHNSDGFVLDGGPQKAFTSRGTYSLGANPSANTAINHFVGTSGALTLRNVHVTEWDHAGVKMDVTGDGLYGALGLTVKLNHFYMGGTHNGDHHMYLHDRLQGGARGLIEGNVCEGAAGYAVHLYAAPANWDVSGNVIFNCGLSGSGGGMLIGGSGHTVVNNTISDCRGYGGVVLWDTTCVDNVIKNNLAWNNYSDLLGQVADLVDNSSGTGNVYASNFWGVIYPSPPTGHYDPTDDTVGTDPLFLVADGSRNTFDDYRLRSGSPALGAGDSTGLSAFGGLDPSVTDWPAAKAFGSPRDAGAFSGLGVTDYDLATSKGAFALTGKAAGLKRGVKTAGAKGTFSLSGKSSLPAVGHCAVTAKGAFALSGKAATPAAGRRAAAAKGSFPLTGKAAGTAKGRRVVPVKGAFALAGKAAGLAEGRRLTSAKGVYALAGKAANFSHTYGLAGGRGSFALTGFGVGILRTYRLGSSRGVFALSGKAAALLTSGSFAIGAHAGTFTVTGGAAGLYAARSSRQARGVFALTGKAARPRAGRKTTAAARAFALAGKAAGLRRGRRLAGAEGTFTVFGPPLLFRRTYGILAAKGLLSLTGRSATLTHHALAAGPTAFLAGFVYGPGLLSGAVYSSGVSSGVVFFPGFGSGASILDE